MTPKTAIKSGLLPVSGGHNIYWATHGNPAGAPLLLVHGGAGHVFDLDRLTGFDFDRHHIITMHQRGVGQSTPRGEILNNDVGSHIEDIESLRAHLGVPRWSILSWSFGAVFMAGYAARYPERCADLAAYAPYLGSEEDYAVIRQQNPALAEKYFAFHNARTGGDVVRSVFNKVSAPDRNMRLKTAFNAAALWTDNLDEQSFYQSRTPAAWDDYFRTYRIAAALDLELHSSRSRFLAQTPIRTPVKLIYGKDDIWSAPHSYAAAVFPHAKITTIRNAGHDIHAPPVQPALRF